MAAAQLIGAKRSHPFAHDQRLTLAAPKTNSTPTNPKPHSALSLLDFSGAACEERARRLSGARVFAGGAVAVIRRRGDLECVITVGRTGGACTSFSSACG
jgi:hypothetical protein